MIGAVTRLAAVVIPTASRSAAGKTSSGPFQHWRQEKDGDDGGEGKLKSGVQQARRIQ